jgi:dipeptidyl aminopeptidase/acylaminoacyl peptidase
MHWASGTRPEVRSGDSSHMDKEAVAMPASGAIRRTPWIFTLVGILLLCAVRSQTAGVQTRRGILPEDYYRFEVIDDPHLSPDATTVAYSVTTVDEKRNRRVSSVWLLRIDGAGLPRQVSPPGYSSSYPRWSPDGTTLATLSAPTSGSASGDPSTKPQIRLVATGGSGEAVGLTTLAGGVQSYQWSPDGSRIAIVSPSGGRSVTAGADHRSDARHYTHITYKFNDTGFDDGSRKHLWVVNVRGGTATQITDGEDWNDTDPRWSPDGERIAFVSDRSGKAYDGSPNTDVWVVSRAGGALTRISDHAFQDESPRWSPDGRRILFAGKTDNHQFPRLYVADSSGRSASQLVVTNLDLIPTELHWPAAGDLVFQARVKGEAQIFRVDLAARAVSAVTSGPRKVHAVDVNQPAGRMIYLANDFRHLDDLYVANVDGTRERQLTHLNTALWSELDLLPVERMAYKSTDGWPIEGFVVKPLGWQAGRKYPMVLVIHGGPRDMFGVDWYHEFQVYAARQWAVFFCNPRGSIGYGEDFERGEINNWGVKDYDDVMSGVDAALERYPWIDRDALGVTGGSYGGYMTNWIVSHNNRFKAAVTLRSLSNFISDEGTREQAYGHQDYFKGDLFENVDQYWEASPLKHARNVRTPVLILHSDMDFQLPVEQAEQWFRALQHFGVPSELVLFPRENHNLTRTGEPRHIVESFNWQLYWFERYLNGNPKARPPDAQ